MDKVSTLSFHIYKISTTLAQKHSLYVETIEPLSERDTVPNKYPVRNFSKSFNWTIYHSQKSER